MPLISALEPLGHPEQAHEPGEQLQLPAPQALQEEPRGGAEDDKNEAWSVGDSVEVWCMSGPVGEGWVGELTSWSRRWWYC